MNKELQGYATVSDCIGWTMQLEGQWFYVATFPSENITHVFPIGGEWFQWGAGITGRIRADSYAYAFSKHLVADVDSGDLYELDAETYTDVGESFIRVRDSAPIYSDLLGEPGKAFEINELQIELETGVGLLTGQGSDPHLMVSVSRDGGKTFGTERFLRAGRLGERITVRAKNFGRFEKQCVIRIRVSDPIYWAIYSAEIDAEVCI